MLKLPKWLKKPDAPSPDLEVQLKATQESLVAAQSATQAAQNTFDAAGTLETQQALTAAQDAERAATLHVERAERLLRAARGREAAAENERKRARLVECQAAITHAAVTKGDAPLVSEVVGHILAAVDAHVTQRCAHAAERKRLANEARNLARELDVRQGFDDRSSTAESATPIADALEKHLATIGHSSAEYAIVFAIIAALSPGRTDVGTRIAPRAHA